MCISNNTRYVSVTYAIDLYNKKRLTPPSNRFTVAPSRDSRDHLQPMTRSKSRRLIGARKFAEDLGVSLRTLFRYEQRGYIPRGVRLPSGRVAWAEDVRDQAISSLLGELEDVDA